MSNVSAIAMKIGEGVAALIRVSLLRLAMGIVRLYQICLSPLVPPSCRFQPTCSAYALEALQRFGPFKGTWLALKRIGHCHPIKWAGGRSGYDPVPQADAHTNCNTHHHEGASTSQPSLHSIKQD